MDEIVANVNWLAVIVGFVVSFLVGWAWYSPKLFGTKWAAGVGISLEEPSKMSMPAMVLQALGTFLLAWVVGVTAKNDALLTVVLMAVTIIVLILAGGYFSRKSAYARNTEAGFVLVMVVIMIVCQGIF